jgi:ABC-type branched-subunit amino acid transport system ATPase component/branched-subunit amino acid ABC-type transport system permease component
VHELLPFIVYGLVTGSVYGLAGTGLVLTYKTSGIFNFGYGALATAAAYLFYWLNVVHGLNWQLSAAISVLGAGLVMGLLMELIARQLSRQTTTMQIVGTVGLIVLVQGLVSIKFGADPLVVPQFIPHGFETFEVFDTPVSYAQLTITLVAVAAVAAMYTLFRFTRTGLAMRAVVDNPDLLDTKGTNPISIRRAAWIIGSLFAALSGVLLAPVVGLDSIALTFLVVQAFGAAAVGRFTNIPITLIGGLVIGIAASLSTKYVLDITWLSGFGPSVPFIVLFIALLATPRGKLVQASQLVTRPVVQWRAPLAVQGAGALIVLAVLLTVPMFAGTHLPFWNTALSRVVLFLSLGLLIRTSGQVSLCQVAFAAIGAVAFSQLAVNAGLPWLVAVLLGALVAVPIGAMLAIPAIRLSGLFLALATFGFGILVEQMFYGRSFMFTPTASGRAMPRPSFATGDKSFYYVILAFVVVAALLIVAIHRMRLGRMLRGMADSPLAVSILGLSTNVTKTLVFCISAYLAAIAGILYGCSVTVASASDPYYASFTSLTLVAILMLAPFGEPWYAVVAGLTALIPGYLSGATVPYWLNAAFGFFAILIAMNGGPQPVPTALQKLLDRLPGRIRPGESAAATGTKPGDARPASKPDPNAPGLEADRLLVRFGGLVALKDVNLRASFGQITGLIGPNGAGKTTMFNACGGLNRPSQGTIRFRGEDISRMSPSARGRRGLGRTFQMMALCDTLTVAENVALGREAALAGNGVLSQVAASRDDERTVRQAAGAAMELCSIADLATMQAGQLSTGQRRLVELARCIAGEFDLLLLDEPSSGLDKDETAQFASVISRVVAERGTGILLVEHDMSLVMDVCQYIYVLDFGVLLFEGDPAAVASSPVVQAAYLGSSDVPADGPTNVTTA